MKRKPRLCTVPGCNGKHLAHGLCTLHYHQKRTHGWRADPIAKQFLSLPRIPA